MVILKVEKVIPKINLENNQQVINFKLCSNRILVLKC